jgi:hypothetical protein
VGAALNDKIHRPLFTLSEPYRLKAVSKISCEIEVYRPIFRDSHTARRHLAVTRLDCATELRIRPMLEAKDDELPTLLHRILPKEWRQSRKK